MPSVTPQMSKHLRQQKRTNLIAIHTVISYKNMYKIHSSIALIRIDLPLPHNTDSCIRMPTTNTLASWKSQVKYVPSDGCLEA